ncbi:MAG: PepSY domain-containing protein, partial [Nocardia sp.]|nr:PepSY domain-containing protein [Nocardia sp.]
MSTTEVPTAPDSVGPETSTPRPGKGAFRALALRLHFYAGLFVGPFLLIAAVTGGLYAVAPSIESFVNRDLLYVDSRGPEKPLSEQVTAGIAVRPDLTLVAVSPAPATGETTRVLFSDPALGESERR